MRSPPRRRLAGRVLALALLAVLGRFPAAAGEAPLIGRVQHVADGDTLTIKTDGARYRIRLHEIDAPEHRQPGSREARAALAGKVEGKYVRVEVETVDDYGRTVGKVWLGNRDINRELVREGHAWAYRRYLQDDSLLADERAARQAGRGLWAAPDPVPPWQWRQTARAGKRPKGDVAPGRCAIKGNINRRGDRIYHRPGDPNYDETRIDMARGERWFCSAAEAERAGWRRPR